MTYVLGAALGVILRLVYVGGQRGWGELLSFWLPMLGVIIIIGYFAHITKED